MGVPAHDGGPDPTRVTTLDDLSRELNLLRSRAARGTRSARVSLEDLARRVNEPKSSIHAYVAGSRLAPSQVLDRIVIALGASAHEQREWAEAWYRVGAHRQSARRNPADAAPVDGVPHQLPGAVDDFVGRTDELRELDELAWHGESGAIVVIAGTAGVGKTALALYWAQTRAERFPDGQLYLDLCGFDPGDPMQLSQALARLLRALGMPNRQISREPDERAAQLRSLMAGRRMLLVLDNAASTEQVRGLLPGPPSCVLVTSRDALSGLVARHGAHRIELDVLAPAEAAELLRTLVGTRPRSGSPEFSAGVLVALAEQCARLPLALRIAADVVRSRPTGQLYELTRGLASGHHELDLLDAGDDPRTALRAVFSWSYTALPPPAARAFRFLALQPVPDTTPDALAALVDVPPSDAQRLLRLLSQAHLVRETRPGRYTMHALLRAYARELAFTIDPEPERADALARLRACYVSALPQPDRRSAAPARGLSRAAGVG